jgi:hypothetical protein
MTFPVTARDINNILVSWHAGEITHRELHDWAQARFAAEDWEPDCDVTNEVLGHLDRMDMNLVIPLDIRLLQQALVASTVEESSRLIGTCYTLFPIEARKQVCGEDEFYAPFCK